MFDDVVQRFLEGEKDIVARFGGDRPVRQVQRHVEAATNVQRDQIFLREIAEVAAPGCPACRAAD